MYIITGKIKMCLSVGVASALLLLACRVNQQKTGAITKHQAEVKNTGGGRLYADRISNGAFMKTMDTDKQSTEFVSYKIGFEDSALILNREARQKKGKYIQYDMENDWKALINGDSLSPVFMQPLVKKNVEMDESILVFEVPVNQEPDTLIYSDSFNGYELRKIVLKVK